MGRAARHPGLISGKECATSITLVCPRQVQGRRSNGLALCLAFPARSVPPEWPRQPAMQPRRAARRRKCHVSQRPGMFRNLEIMPFGSVITQSYFTFLLLRVYVSVRVMRGPEEGGVKKRHNPERRERMSQDVSQKRTRREPKRTKSDPKRTS